MPWSAMKTIPALEGKPREQRELFAEVANEALSKGRTEQEAIFAGTAAVNAKFKPKSIKKQEQEIPWHLKAVLEASKQAQEPLNQGSSTQPTLLIKNAITSDPNRSLVAAEFDKSDRLVLTFDDGQKIITRPIDIKSYVEQYVSVKVDGEGGSTGGLTNPVEYIQFNTNATVSPVLDGQLTWNADEGTLNLGMHDGQVVQQIGLETFYRVKNQSGHSLTNGTVVMAVGAVGNSGQILVDYATVAGVPERTLGLVTHTINNGENGFVTHFGIVRGIDTTGTAYGETWVDGDILYLHPTISGRLTKVRPPAPNFVVTVAMVIHAHSNGQLFVRPTYGSRLIDCADVSITTPQQDQALLYDSANLVWKNTTLPLASLSAGVASLSTVVSAHAGNFGAFDTAINQLDTNLSALSTSVSAFPSLLSGLIRDDILSDKKTWSSDKLNTRLNTKLSFTEEQELEPEEKTLALTNLGINFDFQEWYNSI